MGIDLRLPIGLMFGVMGLILTAYGLLGDKGIYQRSMGVNVNLWWGLALIVFALVMITLARLAGRRRSRRKGAPAAEAQSAGDVEPQG